MGFYFVTTGWIFEIGLCVNSIQFNSRTSSVTTQMRDLINSGLVRWRMAVQMETVAESGKGVCESRK